MTNLEIQEQLANECNNLVKNWYITNYEIGFPRHIHICTFDLYKSSSRYKKRCCKEWMKKHPELQLARNKYGSGGECDFCEMMNFVCIDDEGKIAAITHASKSEIKERLDKI